MRHDAIVIGSGAAGCAAALEAAKHRLDVLLVDDGNLGAEGLARSRSLVMHQWREAIVRGIDTQKVYRGEESALRLPGLRVDTLSRRARALAGRETEAQRRRLTGSGVRLAAGPARLRPGGGVEIDSGQACAAKIVVLATGSRPRRPERFAFDHRVVCDEWSVTATDQVPRSLVVVGAETVGCEYACLFAALGTNVTLLDRRKQMLRYVDRELIAVLHDRMQRMGIEVVLEEGLEKVAVDHRCREPHAVIGLESGRVEKCERLLVAAGRCANVEGLGLEQAGVEIDAEGFVATDDCYRTSQGGVYAVGGVISSSVREGAAVQAGRAAMRHALGLEVGPPEALPVTIHSIPEISMAGFTAEMCERLEIPHAVGVARFEDVLCGALRGDEEGMLKLVIDRADRRVIGVHVIGSHARELVQIGVCVLHRQETVHTLADAIYSAPSLSEVYRVAALDSLDALEAPSSLWAMRGPGAP